MLNPKDDVATVRRLLASESLFYNWLTRMHKPNDIIGESCSGTGCPIHNFLAECEDLFLVEDILVTAHNVQLQYSHGKFTTEPMPNWAGRFVMDLDSYFGEYAVTAKQAELILEKVLVYKNDPHLAKKAEKVYERWVCQDS